MDVQLGRHPPCLAADKVSLGPVGRKPDLQGIRSNSTNLVSCYGGSTWFQFLGWSRVCRNTGQVAAVDVFCLEYDLDAL